MTEELRTKIAQLIFDETKGGYLEDWSGMANLLTREQEGDYFRDIADQIIKVFIDWLFENCEEHRTKTDKEFNYYTRRIDCPLCLCNLRKVVNDEDNKSAFC